jgi:uncharacterized protein with ParB-like and HNH nuclease domain
MADNKLQSLNEIFNQKLFRIPDFQRGFSWEESQLNDFWEDLENLKEDRVHYTGLLTVDPIVKKKIENIEKWQDDLWLIDSGLSAYYIIDGQQRLTTAIVFINEILKQFDENEGLNFNTKNFWTEKFLYRSFGETYKSYILGYERDNPSDEYFKTKILEQTSSSADKVPELTLYTSNLLFVKKYFAQKFEKLTKSELEEIFKKVINRLKFNFYEIDDELDVYVTFETMNNRGKPLSNLELLKNRLIYLTTLLPDELDTRNRLRKDINETWKTIYEYLGKNKDNPLDDDDFLFNHWILYFKYDRKESTSYAKFLLNKKFTAKNSLNGKITLTDIKKYIDSLSESVKSWFYLYNIEYSKHSDNIKEWTQKLNRLGMSAFAPILMVALVKETNETKILELLKSAEQFIFLVFRLSQRPTNTKNSHFYRLASLYYHNKEFGDGEPTTIDKVIGNIDWMSQGESGEGDDYEYYGWFDLIKFKTYIQEQFQKEQGYYTWNAIRYFLYEYELYLQNKANGNQKVTWLDFNKRKKEDTIEHIYPQIPKDECWKSGYSIFSKKKKNSLLHSLGNLVLLAQSKNSELQNKCFDFKKKHQNKNKDDVGFFNGAYSEIAVSLYDNWTPKEILERGTDMLNFMEERWNFKIDEWEDVTKEQLLNLEFIEKE